MGQNTERNVERQAYQQQVREQIDAWQAQIEKLRDDPSHVVGSEHGEKAELDKLQGQLEIIEVQLNDMIAEETGDRWDQLHDGMRRKLVIMRESFEDKTDDSVAV